MSPKLHDSYCDLISENITDEYLYEISIYNSYFLFILN